jgi:uncharacterized protein DUF4112
MLNPKPRVTRIRPLTPGQRQRLDALRKVAQLLDSAFVVPGTSMRIGLDPIVGLIPGLGDLVSPLFTIGILWQAREFGIPKVVQLRMIFNVAIDTVVGLMPVLGDLFDFAWKANDMNMTLLERHAQEEHSATPGDWLFVVTMVLLLVVIAALPFVVLGWLFDALRQLL